MIIIKRDNSRNWYPYTLSQVHYFILCMNLKWRSDTILPHRVSSYHFNFVVLLCTLMTVSFVCLSVSYVCMSLFPFLDFYLCPYIIALIGFSWFHLFLLFLFCSYCYCFDDTMINIPSHLNDGLKYCVYLTPFTLSLFLSLSLSLYIYIYLSLSLSVFFCLSVRLSLSLSLSLSLYLSFSLLITPFSR